MTILGIDIDPTRISAALVTPEAEVLSPMVAAMPEGSGFDTMQQVVMPLCQGLMRYARNHHLTVRAIGAGVAGQVDIGEGVVTHAPRLPRWKGTPVAPFLHETLSLPVVLDSDVNMLATAEHYLGAGKDCDTLLYIGISRHIEGALLRQGEIWHGAHSGAGGMGSLIADWRGENPVTLEEVTGESGIEWMYQSRSPNVERIPFARIVRLAGEEKSLALKVLRDSARIFGTVIAPVVSLTDPELLVIGGSVPATGELWWPWFERALNEGLLPAVRQVRLAPARVSDYAVLRGAAWRAWQHLSG